MLVILRHADNVMFCTGTVFVNKLYAGPKILHFLWSIHRTNYTVHGTGMYYADENNAVNIFFNPESSLHTIYLSANDQCSGIPLRFS
jgi:hypothetical protein